MSDPQARPDNTFSYLDDPSICRLLFGVMVKRLGGKIQITDTDLKEIEGKFLHEKGKPGTVFFELKQITKNSSGIPS